MRSGFKTACGKIHPFQMFYKVIVPRHVIFTLAHIGIQLPLVLLVQLEFAGVKKLLDVGEKLKRIIVSSKLQSAYPSERQITLKYVSVDTQAILTVVSVLLSKNTSIAAITTVIDYLKKTSELLDASDFLLLALRCFAFICA